MLTNVSVTQRFRRTAICLGFAAAALSTSAATAHAQWGSTLYGVAETDTDEVRLFLLGISAHPGGRGFYPVFSISGYHLSYPGGSGRVTVRTLTPAAGVGYSFDGGQTSLKLGYQFRDSNKPTVAREVGVPEAEGGGGGIGLSFSHNYWGDGRIGFQTLASYGFKGESFFGRVRVTNRLASFTRGGLRAGVEAGIINTPTYSSPSVGAVLEWQTGGPNIGFGIGKRFKDSNATYYKIEFNTKLFR